MTPNIAVSGHHRNPSIRRTKNGIVPIRDSNVSPYQREIERLKQRNELEKAKTDLKETESKGKKAIETAKQEEEKVKKARIDRLATLKEMQAKQKGILDKLHSAADLAQKAANIRKTWGIKTDTDKEKADIRYKAAISADLERKAKMAEDKSKGITQEIKEETKAIKQTKTPIIREVDVHDYAGYYRQLGKSVEQENEMR